VKVAGAMNDNKQDVSVIIAEAHTPTPPRTHRLLRAFVDSLPVLKEVPEPLG
jgi:hypothetical protein